MSGIYTSKEPTLESLGDVQAENVSNNDIIQYNSTSTNWENKSDFTTDEIDCRVLRVSQTADIGGRLANVGVASFVNDEFIFQNGISNLGDTLYIDNVNNKVGINISEPEEELEVDGSIQIDSANVSRLKFQQTGPTPHAEGEIDGEEDGTNGGQLEFYTKVDGGSITKKLTINNVGAIGIGDGEEKFGVSGSVLTTNGEGSAPTWTYPYILRVYCGSTYQPADNVEADMRQWVNDTDFGTTNYNNDFTGTGTTVGEWTCPTTGFYKINIQAVCSAPLGEGNLTRSNMYIQKDTGSGYTQIRRYMFDVNRNNLSTQDVYQNTAQINTLIQMDSGDKLKGRILLDQQATGDARYVSAGKDSTFWEIHRIA